MAPRQMAMRDGGASFLAHGWIELSIFGRDVGGTSAQRHPDGSPRSFSLSVPCGHGKGALVLIAWESGTVAWRVEITLGHLARHSPCVLCLHDILSPFQATTRPQMS